MNSDMAPELDDLWREARTHIENWKFDKAIEIYKYILITYGDDNVANEYANACLGEVLLTLGQTAAAENHIRKAISHDPGNPHYRYLLGFIYDRRCEWGKAIREYKAALDKEPNNRLYLRALGESIFNSGDKHRGLTYLHKAEALYPSNSGMLSELATAYLSLGDVDTAMVYGEKAVMINPDDIMAWAVLRKIESFQKQLEDKDKKLAGAPVLRFQVVQNHGSSSLWHLRCEQPVDQVNVTSNCDL